MKVNGTFPEKVILTKKNILILLRASDEERICFHN